MRKGFTLVELLIVIIIVGVLATLGVMQYRTVIEKSRGAEAKQILGNLRSICAARYVADVTTIGCTAANLGIGASDTQIPNTCRPTNFFSFASAVVGTTGVRLTATRCIAGGKSPNGVVAGTVVLTTDYSTGADNWTSTAGY